MPSLISKFFAAGGPAQADQTPATTAEPMGSQEAEALITTSQGERFFATEELMNLSPELLDLVSEGFHQTTNQGTVEGPQRQLDLNRIAPMTM